MDSKPRLLIIGAGSRGNAYAEAVTALGLGVIAAVAEPDEFKRQQLGAQYIWNDGPSEGQSFEDWKDFLKSRNPQSIDGVFICTLDEMHKEIITALAPLKIHIMCEKPLATTLKDCLQIYQSLKPNEKESLFSICHVLRYSPHNMLLQKLLREKVIGDIISIEHTEPVGWWHFSHSYVRGNWRKESTSAPSLLTKSCHDIDFLLWLVSHQPSTITSSGSLVYFKKSRKPAAAGEATNCLSCPIEDRCKYSAKKIYLGRLREGDTGWPVKIVVPDIEKCLEHGQKAAEDRLLTALGGDYGKCVYEADNDVCDDQTVTITWDEKQGENAKMAIFHMVAFTEKICERRSRIYGTNGEIEADSTLIKVHDFETGETKTHEPPLAGGGHGGGDSGLAQQFVKAIVAVKNGMSVTEAQRTHIGCNLDEIVTSHAVVFAAEDARRKKEVVDWPTWWASQKETFGT